MIIAALGAAAALGACNKQPPEDQNIVVDNGSLANADVEALPPDESSATPSEDLANGADAPEVNDLNAAGNSY